MSVDEEGRTCQWKRQEEQWERKAEYGRCECMHDMPMILEGRICHEDMPVGEAGGAGRILAQA